MTPVAIFDTVTITGSNINRASLASWDKIQKLDLKIGDKIQVAKANDVIPDIKKKYTLTTEMGPRLILKCLKTLNFVRQAMAKSVKFCIRRNMKCHLKTVWINLQKF